MTQHNDTSVPMEPYGAYVDGVWLSGAGQTRQVVDPRTELPIAEVTEASAEQVSAAVAAASAAGPSWAATTVADRADALRAVAAQLRKDADELKHLVCRELGAPEALAEKLHVALPATVLDATAEAAAEIAWKRRVGNSSVELEPVGVVAAVTPWNYPLHQPVAKVAGALMAGCTMVLKPAEQSALTGLGLARAIERAGVPAGVFNLVLGGPEAGEALVSDRRVDMVSFTGSTEVGQKIAAQVVARCGRVALELGGKSPSVVLDDVSESRLDAAVKVTLANCFLNSGQTCTAWTRLLVPRSMLGRVEELLARYLARHVPGMTMGPLIDRRQADRVEEYVAEAVKQGARVMRDETAEARRPESGYYVTPTVLLDVDPTSRVAQEEIFGPVLSVIAYGDEREAVEIANGTPYGLAACVWSDDEERATSVARRIRSGQVDVNGGRFNPLAPFGGFKSSGIGRELGVYGVEDFCELKSIQY
ncbi:aldehyde dehydrogenase family protein [Microbispora sp. CA-102843]|uniref:aldehyde dehydrogenase family protein n=1 Tax=Microbispora sp. CA-102843 TaxID=3239952 RepID=UPI003D8CA916